jgi:hypothetical protein
MRIVGAVLAALALVASASASAAIVANHGIGGVTLGQTRKQVRTRLGNPLTVKRGLNDFGRYTVFRYANVTVNFQGNAGATALTTTSAAERTARGVGVGSTEAQVRAGVRGVHCSRVGALRHCTVGRELPGRRVTDFVIRRGRVVRVVVGFVLD